MIVRYYECRIRNKYFFGESHLPYCPTYILTGYICKLTFILQKIYFSMFEKFTH